jgi:hypothetical protein
MKIERKEYRKEMIEWLGPQRGAWNDDITRLIEKVNELVDIVNGNSGKKEISDSRNTKEREKEKEKVPAKVSTKVMTTHQSQDKDETKAKAKVTSTVGTQTPKKERNYATRGY